MQCVYNYEIEEGALKVLAFKTMHGANYFSGGPIILIRLDLGDYDEVFTNEIDSFYVNLKKTLPSLYEHCCSVGKPGGFFQRVEKGTLLGHVCEHVAIELQTLAGMDVAYGKTRSTGTQGVYNVIFRYFDELAGIFAGKAAINLVNTLLKKEAFDVKQVVETLIDIREKRLLGPSTQSIVDEAAKRNIPYLRLDNYNLVQLGTGCYGKWIRATLTSSAGAIAVETADDKLLTNLVLHDAGIPTIDTICIKNIEEAIDYWHIVKEPLVLKPRHGHSGKGVSVAVNSEAEIKKAFQIARKHDEDVLVQKYVKGNDYRFLVIDGEFVAAVQLMPPQIIGDGINSIKKLVDILNESPMRTKGDKGKLSLVEIDEITERLIEDRGYNLDTVLKAGEILILKNSGNMRLGGSAIDVTDEVGVFNKFLLERVAKVIDLDVIGIDVIAKNVKDSFLDSAGYVIEINAAPDFRMHISPTAGKKRDVASKFLNLLFDGEKASHIPLISVTGSTGKTLFVRLVSYTLLQVQRKLGVISSEGLFISEKQLLKGDMSNPESVALLLKDPTIDCAVIETSHEGIVQRGLGYEYADYGVVLNFDETDPVGSDDIRIPEDLAYAMSVVAEQIYDDGYAVLNADNEFICEMESRVYSKVIWFSKNEENYLIKESIEKGNLAVVLDKEKVVILNASNRIEAIDLKEVALWRNKDVSGTIEVLLAAVVVLYVFGIDLKEIKEAFVSFNG